MGNHIRNGESYSNGGFGGGKRGSVVIANPDKTPTDTLKTLQIGSKVYSIEGGGSGVGTKGNLRLNGNIIETIIAVKNED